MKMHFAVLWGKALSLGKDEFEENVPNQFEFVIVQVATTAKHE
jgi:hypothetical protein